MWHHPQDSFSSPAKIQLLAYLLVQAVESDTGPPECGCVLSSRLHVNGTTHEVMSFQIQHGRNMDIKVTAKEVPFTATKSSSFNANVDFL